MFDVCSVAVAAYVVVTFDTIWSGVTAAICCWGAKPSGETEGPYFNRFRQHTPVGLQKLTGFAGPNKLDI